MALTHQPPACCSLEIGTELVGLLLSQQTQPQESLRQSAGAPETLGCPVLASGHCCTQRTWGSGKRAQALLAAAVCSAPLSSGPGVRNSLVPREVPIGVLGCWGTAGGWDVSQSKSTVKLYLRSVSLPPPCSGTYLGKRFSATARVHCWACTFLPSGRAESSRAGRRATLGLHDLLVQGQAQRRGKKC